MDNGGGEVDHGGEAEVGLFAPHDDAFELLKLSEEVLDEVAPLIDFNIDLARPGASGMLRNENLGAAPVEIGDDGVAIEGLIAEQGAELEVLDQRGHADRVEPVPRQQDEADQVSQCVGQGQDLRGHAAFGAAYGLILGPPFAPCPWR